MTYFLIILNVVSLAYLLIRSVSDFGKLNYFFIFAIFNFLYGFAIPFEIILFQRPLIIYGQLATVNQIELILFLSTLSNFGFYAGMLLSRNKSNAGAVRTEEFSHPKSIYVLLIFIFIFMMVFNRHDLIQSFSSYTENFTITYNNSTYAFAKEILFSVLSIISLLFLQRKSKFQWVSVSITAILFLFGAFTKDKNPILMAAIPWFWITLFYLYKKFINRKYLILIAFFVGITIIPIFNGIYGSYRGKWDADVVKYYLNSGLYIHFESSAVMLSMLDATSTEQRFYGNTYMESFVNWIPKSVWKQRPETLAESYAKYKMKDEWSPGKGFGFSLLAESYLNFGILGAFIQYFLMGLIFGFMQKITYKIFSGNYFYADSIFFIWAFNELVLMHRGQFNMISNLIRYLLPLYAFYSAFDKLNILSYMEKWKKQK